MLMNDWKRTRAENIVSFGSVLELRAGLDAETIESPVANCIRVEIDEVLKIFMLSRLCVMNVKTILSISQ